MHPFEFVILLLSFVYTLALTHLLFAATRMIRHRRDLVFSWPHALWMLATFVLIAGNWLSFWDFHNLHEMNLPTIAVGFLISIGEYFICALVSPDFEGGEGYDMRTFYRAERRTWITAWLLLCVVGTLSNVAAGASLNIQNWAAQNLIVVPIVALCIPPLFVESRWVAIGCPLLLTLLSAAYPILYYPVLK